MAVFPYLLTSLRYIISIEFSYQKCIYLYFFGCFNGPVPASFFFISVFQRLRVNTYQGLNFANDWIQNGGPLVSEATTQPTEPMGKGTNTSLSFKLDFAMSFLIVVFSWLYLLPLVGMPISRLGRLAFDCLQKGLLRVLILNRFSPLLTVLSFCNRFSIFTFSHFEQFVLLLLYVWVSFVFVFRPYYLFFCVKGLLQKSFSWPFDPPKNIF